MTSSRRVGSATSETRDQLLDCVEELMLEQGYVAVTYRAVAKQAGVTSGLVQYYFPKLDDLFIASIRRYTQSNIERLTKALARNAEQPRRVLWSYSRNEATAALTMEYLALANHRASVRAEIAKVTEQVQGIQLEALEKHRSEQGAPAGEPSSSALLFLLTQVPKMLRYLEGVGLSAGHADVVALFERHLDAVEPRKGRGKRKRPVPRSRGRHAKDRLP